jgi:hypothetical protein
LARAPLARSNSSPLPSFSARAPGSVPPFQGVFRAYSVPIIGKVDESHSELTMARRGCHRHSRSVAVILRHAPVVRAARETARRFGGRRAWRHGEAERDRIVNGSSLVGVALRCEWDASGSSAARASVVDLKASRSPAARTSETKRSLRGTTSRG